MVRHWANDVRRAAFAGTWYSAKPAELGADVDAYLAAVDIVSDGDLLAVIAPHAGLLYSGPVAAWSYRMLAGRPIDVLVLVGPSHYAAFDGVAVDDREAYESPLGLTPVSQSDARQLAVASPAVRVDRHVHSHEHALEMQLPFLQRVAPGVPIVPVLMGEQSRDTVDALARVLTTTFAGRRVVLVASTDLSHFFASTDAARLDARVIGHVERADAEGLMTELERYPEHERGRFVACGGGPAVSVLRTATALGARAGRLLKYGDSGDVSGDHDHVVGYLAAAVGSWPALARVGDRPC
jgi:hypothetical protein